MRINRVETLECDAGWRNYHFLKVCTDEGMSGWSEFDESYGPPALSHLIEAYAAHILGRDPRRHERLYAELAATARPAPFGMAAEALGAIENALLDLTAKSFGVPVHDLLGGRLRDRVPVYWSHCVSWRIGHPEVYGKGITDLDGVRAAGREAVRRGFSAVKTNMFRYGAGPATPWMSGFGAPFEPGLNLDRSLVADVVAHLEALREGIGSDADLLIDLNFNARAAGLLRMLRALEDLDLYWVELDLHNPDALAQLRAQARHPIASCETLCGVRQFLPYLQRQAVDVAIVDAIWNGVWQAMKIAAVAEAHDVNVAPHNFYSHLATMMNVQFAAAVPNLQIVEDDIDRIPWDDELFDSVPQIDAGAIVVSDRPGWGVEPDESALRRHPPREHSYLGLS